MKIIKFSRYREFTYRNISCWYDRKDRTYCSIIDGNILTCDSEKELKKAVALALRMVV